MPSFPCVLQTRGCKGERQKKIDNFLAILPELYPREIGKTCLIWVMRSVINKKAKIHVNHGPLGVVLNDRPI